MTLPVDASLAAWGLEGASCTFVAGRENQVYRVSTNAGDFALRIKRPGYRDEAELLSELHWLEAMERAGLHVPRPLPSRLAIRLAGQRRTAPPRCWMLCWQGFRQSGWPAISTIPVAQRLAISTWHWKRGYGCLMPQPAVSAVAPMRPVPQAMWQPGP